MGTDDVDALQMDESTYIDRIRVQEERVQELQGLEFDYIVVPLEHSKYVGEHAVEDESADGGTATHLLEHLERVVADVFVGGEQEGVDQLEGGQALVKVAQRGFVEY